MKKFDELFKKVELFERLAVYGDRKSFLQALAQDATTWEEEARREGDVPETHEIPPPSPEVPAAPVAAPPAPVAPAAGLSVDPTQLEKIQNYLNKAMLDKWPPVQPDGKWGPETAKMVSQWAKANNLNFGMQQLVDILKNRAMGNAVSDTINTGKSYDLYSKYI